MDLTHAECMRAPSLGADRRAASWIPDLFGQSKGSSFTSSRTALYLSYTDSQGMAQSQLPLSILHPLHLLPYAVYNGSPASDAPLMLPCGYTMVRGEGKSTDGRVYRSLLVYDRLYIYRVLAKAPCAASDNAYYSTTGTSKNTTWQQQ